jgi:serine/threonine protein kinase
MTPPRPVRLSDAAVHHLVRAADWPDLSGTRYTVLEELGQGGMGTVFRARDELLGREVALKVLRSADAPRDLAERLEREAGVLARLEHPGVVPVHDRGVLPDGRAWYVMKLVRGQRLDAWVANGPSLSERLDLLRRVAETLAFAHARGVVHRDLKPANIMVGEFGEVLVLDWGVAKLTAERRSGVAAEAIVSDSHAGTPPSPYAEGTTTAHGTILGSVGFMSPEQERGDVDLVDQRTDVFGLGALLRVMTTPMPMRLEAIAARATSADRDQRYSDASAFAEDLRRFQNGDPVSAYREGSLERLERLVSKYRTPILLVLVYLLLRMLFIIFSNR